MSSIEEIISRMIIASGAKNQQEMIEKTGLSPGIASKWKKRGNVPDSGISKVAIVTGVTYEWLKTGEGEMRAPKEASFDMAIIKQVIEAAMEHLQINNLQMAPDKFAELIEVLYEEISESGAEQVNKGTVARLIKLAM